MEDEEDDGGEHTNSFYYGNLAKTYKVRIEFKNARVSVKLYQIKYWDGICGVGVRRLA